MGFLKRMFSSPQPKYDEELSKRIAEATDSAQELLDMLKKKRERELLKKALED